MGFKLTCCCNLVCIKSKPPLFTINSPVAPFAGGSTDHVLYNEDYYDTMRWEITFSLAANIPPNHYQNGYAGTWIVEYFEGGVHRSEITQAPLRKLQYSHSGSPGLPDNGVIAFNFEEPLNPNQALSTGFIYNIQTGVWDKYSLQGVPNYLVLDLVRWVP